MKAALAIYPSAMVLTLALGGCGPQLEYGSYEADLSGTSMTFSGAESAFSGVVDVDIAYDKPRGTLTYEATFCEGFVAYLSGSPCFNTLTISDTTDGLISIQEEAWSAVIGSTDEGAALVCQGTESISLKGDIDSDTEAALEVTYHLNLASGSAPGCGDLLADKEARVIAAGSLTYTGN